MPRLHPINHTGCYFTGEVSETTAATAGVVLVVSGAMMVVTSRLAQRYVGILALGMVFYILFLCVF